MTLRKSLATLIAAAIALAGITMANEASAATVKIEAATLAPKKSPWGKVFKKWSKALKKKSNGQLEIHWYYGTQGDEGNMVDKLKSGQLDMGAFTSIGLSHIYFDILVLTAPGLFSSWSKLDEARAAMWGDFKKGAKDAGFMLLGSGDVGLARTMTKGKAIRSPDDLVDMKIYAWDQDKVAPVIASVIGYTPVYKAMPALLPSLSSGQVNVINVPCLAATQMQWHTHLDHLHTSVLATVIGGLVMREKKYEDMPADLREMFEKSSKKAGDILSKRIRKEDKKAYKLLKKRMTVVKHKRKEKRLWRKKFREVRKRLAQGVYKADLMARAEALAGK